MGELVMLHSLSKSVYDDYCMLVKKGNGIRVKGIIWGYNNVKAPLDEKMARKSWINDLIMHDSGGASIGFGTFEVSDEMIKAYIDELVKTYNYTKCDIGVALDVPFESGQTSFENALKRTLKYTVLLWNRKKGEWAFYPTIHGMNIEQRKKWIKETINVLGESEIDGWAGSLSFFAPGKVADATISLETKGLFTCMREIVEFGNKPYHIFAATSKKSLVTLAYFSKFIKTRITVDSASAVKAVANGKIFTDELDTIDIGRKAGANIKTFACGCDYCRMLIAEKKFPPYDEFKGGIHTMLVLHNVFKFNYFLNEALNLAEDRELFVKRYRNLVPDIEQLVNVVEVLVGEKSGDIEKLDKYFKG